jgi:hypothetical protein
MKILSSFIVESITDEIVSIGGVSMPEQTTVESICNDPDSGFELDGDGGNLFMVFACDGVQPEMETTNYTVTGKPHHVEINDSLVGARPNDRFRPKPTAS